MNTMSQNYEKYTEEDHQTWSVLSKRQSKLRGKRIAREYLSGFEQLKLQDDRIADIEKISGRLTEVSGWSLIPVTGLIPTRDFFYMLINKQYPVTVSIRRPHEIDFSEQPDIFHDVFGHLPLLTNEKFVKFLTAYSIIALKYVSNERAVDFLGRLYWYTYEMGIIREDGELKPYGGAIITSAEEIANAQSENTPKYAFDIDQVFRTPYNPFKLQKEYFVIDSFDDLFDSLRTIESKLISNLLLPEIDCTLRNFPINQRLEHGYSNVISFLNDVQYRYPDAISFAAGQPDESFFDLDRELGKLDLYIDYRCAESGLSRQQVLDKIGQYNKTKGIIADLLARYLLKDENMAVQSDQIMITTGAQEAFAVLSATLCDKEGDLILVEEGSYIGMSSCAHLLGYGLEGVCSNDEGIDLVALKSKLIEASRRGKRVKLLYIVPDYQSPSGSCLSIGSRLKLLELAQRYNFLIVEDNAYGNFTYADKRIPTLKSLDKFNRVIYVGSFSKILFPGLRIGFILADQQLENESGDSIPLIDELAKAKAAFTVNTSTISQAILGGILISQGFSLTEMNRPKLDNYRRKCSEMLDCLRSEIAAHGNGWAAGIGWNEPQGGFFIKLTLPFAVDFSDVQECAKKHKVVFSPMRYFHISKGGEKEIRLSFSNLSHEEIRTGIHRLAAYLRLKAGQQSPHREKGVLDLVR